MDNPAAAGEMTTVDSVCPRASSLRATSRIAVSFASPKKDHEKGSEVKARAGAVDVGGCVSTYVSWTALLGTAPVFDTATGTDPSAAAAGNWNCTVSGLVIVTADVPTARTAEPTSPVRATRPPMPGKS